MFNIFRRKDTSGQEALKEALLTAFSELKKASKKSGIEREFHVAAVFGSLVGTLAQYFPNVVVEEDGPAMNILSAGGDNPNWDSITSDVDHVIQQVSSCPRDSDYKVIVMRSFLSPVHIEKNYECSRLAVYAWTS